MLFRSDSLHDRIVKLAASFDKQYKEKMSVDEICLLLVNRVRRTRKITGPYSIAEDQRVWRPTQEKRKAVDLEQERVVDRGKGINFSGEECVFCVEKPKVNLDRKSTRLNSSHANISYAVFCLKKKTKTEKKKKKIHNFNS